MEEARMVRRFKSDVFLYDSEYVYKVWRKRFVCGEQVIIVSDCE
jgi:hypothetical protein